MDKLSESGGVTTAASGHTSVHPEWFDEAVRGEDAICNSEISGGKIVASLVAEIGSETSAGTTFGRTVFGSFSKGHFKP